MKKHIVTVCLILIISISSIISAQQKDTETNHYTTAEWVKDIDYMVVRMEIMHPNLYANISKEKFYEHVASLKSRISSMSDAGIMFAIQETLALVKDVHTGMAFWEMDKDNPLMPYLDGYPLSFYIFTDGLFVFSSAKELKDIVGKKVISLNGVRVKDFLPELFKLVSADNHAGKVSTGAMMISFAGILSYAGVENAFTELNLELEDNNGVRSITSIKPVAFYEALKVVVQSQIGFHGDSIAYMNDGAQAPLPLYLSRPNETVWLQYLPDDKLVYAKMLSFGKPKEEYHKFWKEIFAAFDENNAEKLVLDIRNNGGGDHWELPLMKGIIARPELDQPDKLFVIIGRAATSAAQHFSTQFDMYTNATFIGENTSGKPNHYGAQRVFKLPNSGLPVRSSIVFHQDKTAWDFETCTAPQFYTPLSSDDYRNNHDPAMDLILSFDQVADLYQKFKKTLGKAYNDGGMGNLKKAYFSFMDRYGKYYPNKNWLFSKFSWWIYPNKKSMDDYAEYLAFYVEQCPDSPEANSALASRLSRTGDIEEAKKYFRKSLEIYPDNHVDQMRLGLILLEEKMKGNKK